MSPLSRRSYLHRNPVAVIGGGTGGFAAALAAARAGLRVLLTEETDWIGGQLTAQAVPPDESAWVESFGGCRSYRRYRTAIRSYYRQHYPLTPEARDTWNLNPGGGTVSKLCHEPRVSLAVLEALLLPYVSSGHVTVLLQHKPVRAKVKRDRVETVTLNSLVSGTDKTIQADYFLDATELGDLLPMTRTEYVTGWESTEDTGEAEGPTKAQPANMQSFTSCFAVSYHPGEDHSIEKPEEYLFWRDYIPEMRQAWTGRLLSWIGTDPLDIRKARKLAFDPTADIRAAQGTNLWLYRRILRRNNLATSASTADISLVNWPQNDYWLGNLCEVSDAEAARHLRRAKQLSLSLLYWMQTEAPRHDHGYGYRELQLRHDVVGSEDGLAKYPYVRESRRIRAEFTVLLQHVNLELRMKATGKSRQEVAAIPFTDSIGTGHYNVDLHPSSGGDNYVIYSSLPFQIPLGALIPRRVENLLPVCKNIGTTHLTNGCYRLHPVEWSIGEAAGLLVAFARQRKTSPRAVRNQQGLLREFQEKLQQEGVDLEWPSFGPR